MVKKHDILYTFSRYDFAKFPLLGNIGIDIHFYTSVLRAGWQLVELFFIPELIRVELCVIH